MSVNPKKIVIVGAGVAGLTLAYKLSLEGKDVLLVEKDFKVGGLARSFSYNGYVFDIGPHRFHTDIPEVIDFVKEILDGDYLTIERKSGVWMFGRYFEWPLNLSALFGMPIHVLISVGMDLLRKSKNKDESFEDYAINRYGKTLYKIFFKPYTEKFLGISCSEISRDWAVTSIERAVIDKKIRADSLFNVTKSVFSRKPPLKFIYPGSGGIATFSKKLIQKIVNNGGSILLNSEITGVIKSGKEIKKIIIGGEKYDCDLLVWTAPISEILHLLGQDGMDLEYLSLILFNYCINHSPPNNYQWCYYGSEDIPFNRISTPSLFSPSLAPQGRTGICVEVTCKKGDYRWESPEHIEPLVRKSLFTTGIVKDEKDVLALNIERVANAYPIYALDYKKMLSDAFKILDGFMNLKLLGRTGTFWYNNMDHSIEAAINLYREIIGYRA